MRPPYRRMSAALAAPLLVLTAATGFAGSAEDAVFSLIDAMRAVKRLNEPAFAKLAQCRRSFSTAARMPALSMGSDRGTG